MPVGVKDPPIGDQGKGGLLGDGCRTCEAAGAAWPSAAAARGLGVLGEAADAESADAPPPPWLNHEIAGVAAPCCCAFHGGSGVVQTPPVPTAPSPLCWPRSIGSTVRPAGGSSPRPVCTSTPFVLPMDSGSEASSGGAPGAPGLLGEVGDSWPLRSSLKRHSRASKRFITSGSGWWHWASGARPPCNCLGAAALGWLGHVASLQPGPTGGCSGVANCVQACWGGGWGGAGMPWCG